MTIYAVDIIETTHTCPGNAEPHPIDIIRRVVHVTPGGPCRTPVTIRCGDTTAVVPCGRHEPSERQCGACRVIITVHSAHTRHLGYQGPAHLNPAHLDEVAQ